MVGHLVLIYKWTK